MSFSDEKVTDRVVATAIAKQAIDDGLLLLSSMTDNAGGPEWPRQPTMRHLRRLRIIFAPMPFGLAAVPLDLTGLCEIGADGRGGTSA